MTTVSPEGTAVNSQGRKPLVTKSPQHDRSFGGVAGPRVSPLRGSEKKRGLGLFPGADAPGYPPVAACAAQTAWPRRRPGPNPGCSHGKRQAWAWHPRKRHSSVKCSNGRGNYSAMSREASGATFTPPPLQCRRAFCGDLRRPRPSGSSASSAIATAWPRRCTPFKKPTNSTATMMP